MNIKLIAILLSLPLLILAQENDSEEEVPKGCINLGCSIGYTLFIIYHLDKGLEVVDQIVNKLFPFF